jgi:hypothetical protein
MSRPFEPNTPPAAPWNIGADHRRPALGSESRYSDSPSYGSYDSGSHNGSGHSAGAYTATTVADRPDHREGSYSDDDSYADDAYPDDPDDGYYEYDEPIDRRWIWVAGVAAAILLVAVICTVVILGGGDSGPVTATVTPPAPTTSAAAAVTTTPSAAAAPRVAPVAPPTASLAPETVTTITPSATPTASVEAPTEAALPAAAAPPAAASQTVTYRITGNHPLLDFVTVIYTDGQGALQTDVNVALPWSKSITLNPGVGLTSVTATSVTGQLNCAITDGSGTPIAAQSNNAMITSCTK